MNRCGMCIVLRCSFHIGQCTLQNTDWGQQTDPNLDEILTKK